MEDGGDGNRVVILFYDCLGGRGKNWKGMFFVVRLMGKIGRVLICTYVYQDPIVLPRTISHRRRSSKVDIYYGLLLHIIVSVIHTKLLNL